MKHPKTANKAMETEQPRYVVDGHEFPDEESNLAGDGQFPPFRIFDIPAQDYVGTIYETRDAAQMEADRLNSPLKPGPWVVNDHAACPVEGWTAVSIVDEDGPADVVAYCHPRNAPAIAAAPELLAALEILLEQAELVPDFGYFGSQRSAATSARNAIAKAKGAAQGHNALTNMKGTI